MKAMQSTMVYLTSEQKTGLAKRAQQQQFADSLAVTALVDGEAAQ